MLSDRGLSQSSEGQVSPDEVPSRRGSTPSDNGTASIFPSSHLYASNPDLTSLTGSCVDESSASGAATLSTSRQRDAGVEHVLKVYRADQSFRYIVCHRVNVDHS